MIKRFSNRLNEKNDKKIPFNQFKFLASSGKQTNLDYFIKVDHLFNRHSTNQNKNRDKDIRKDRVDTKDSKIESKKMNVTFIKEEMNRLKIDNLQTNSLKLLNAIKTKQNLLKQIRMKQLFGRDEQLEQKLLEQNYLEQKILDNIKTQSSDDCNSILLKNLVRSIEFGAILSNNQIKFQIGKSFSLKSSISL